MVDCTGGAKTGLPLRQVNRYYKGWRQYNTLVTKIVTKAILRGGFSFGAAGPLSAELGR